MANPAATDVHARVGRVGAAAVLYFLLVFGAGLVLGPVRVLWLEPWLGPLLAEMDDAGALPMPVTS